jgi:hypothetical protein
LNEYFSPIIQAFLLKNAKGKFFSPFLEKISLLFIKYFDEYYLPFLKVAIENFLTPSSLYTVSVRSSLYYTHKVLFENDFFEMILKLLKN